MGVAPLMNFLILKRQFLASSHIAFIVIGAASGLSGLPSYAQTLKPAEQAKVKTLKARLNKAAEARSRATSILSDYKLFFVNGKIQSGDNSEAIIYGTAVKKSYFAGFGSIHDKSFLRVLNPTDEDLIGSGAHFQGLCTFAGVVRGTNTYVSVRSQPQYIQAYNEAQKWGAIEDSIQAEINAVYLPYERKAKNQATVQAAKQTRLAQLRQEKAAAQADADAQNQARVNEARERLAQEQLSVETTKQQKFTKESADAEIARLEAEAAKAKEEKNRLEAEAKKQATEEALRKAKELEELNAKNQAAIEVLKNTPTLIAGQQLGSVRLGMTEAQVLKLMGLPKVTTQLNKLTRDQNGTPRWLPSRIRRDRYFLPATAGLDIFYEGSPEELSFYSRERGIENVKAGDLKTEFVYDVFFLEGKVVQIQSDSPQFFSPEKKNILSGFPFDKEPYDAEVVSYRESWRTRKPIVESGEEFSNFPLYSAFYIGSRGTGFSTCLEFLKYRQGVETPAPIPIPTSREKLIIHYPNTVPFTGDFEKGISVLNRLDNGSSDADNREERFESKDLNPR